MDGNRQMEVHYINTGFPYTVTESLMDLFEGLTYAQADSVLAEASHDQAFKCNRMPVVLRSSIVYLRSLILPFTWIQVIWQDNVDPDNMTYEFYIQELLELGETVGTQSRGLTQECIASLPVTKYKCSFFSIKKSQRER
ncbi:hypothetical protein BHE74_00031656 [Ensete ventricosum]|uniref:Uncharacterized protein n=1 Tax=Ensete ventricosum TaxID=4639 RepID=A0A444FRQ2_ENSVE|nr:hypothetical protein B296_00048399 [Ensete ventricosum]RWW25318.1 hypothetical protein GW17_00010343 [Ensete ventricosum]RWW61292.1 hypothetical protein BHE74_00031656 [Ensete ventricosum]RZR74633.1 hypothetical protein BHM03_00039903 [Ensete ventricosum]